MRDGTQPPAKRRRVAVGKGGGVDGDSLGGDSRRGITGKPGRRKDSSTGSRRTVGTRGDNGPGQQCGEADKKQTSSARQFGGSEPSRPDVAAQRGKKRGAPKYDSKERRPQQQNTNRSEATIREINCTLIHLHANSSAKRATPMNEVGISAMSCSWLQRPVKARPPITGGVTDGLAPIHLNPASI